jgi:hypothetical protein
MREFMYVVFWAGLIWFGLTALDNHPQQEGAGLVLGLYVFVASTAIIGLIHYARSSE